MGHNAEKKKVKLNGPHIKPEDSRFFDQIYCDKNRVIQVVVNFLSNSIKFSHADSEIDVSIEILEQ